MQGYPRFDSARIILQSDLSQLVYYNLYGLECEYVDTDNDEFCKNLEVDRRVKDATSIVEGWHRTGVLGDRAIGDALLNIVSGMWSVEDAPWAE